MRSWLARL